MSEELDRFLLGMRRAARPRKSVGRWLESDVRRRAGVAEEGDQPGRRGRSGARAAGGARRGTPRRRAATAPVRERPAPAAVGEGAAARRCGRPARRPAATDAGRSRPSGAAPHAAVARTASGIAARAARARRGGGRRRASRRRAACRRSRCARGQGDDAAGDGRRAGASPRVAGGRRRRAAREVGARTLPPGRPRSATATLEIKSRAGGRARVRRRQPQRPADAGGAATGLPAAEHGAGPAGQAGIRAGCRSRSTLDEGQTQTLSFTLREARARSGSSACRRARSIYLDDRRGRCRQADRRVPGPHRLRVEAADGVVFSEEHRGEGGGETVRRRGAERSETMTRPRFEVVSPAAAMHGAAVGAATALGGARVIGGRWSCWRRWARCRGRRIGSCGGFCRAGRASRSGRRRVARSAAALASANSWSPR